MNIERQYIGARYVPILGGAWDRSKSYEALTIVQANNNSYTSKKPVPAGIDIANTEYWVITGNFNGQVEEYRKDVERYRADTVVYNARVDELSQMIGNVKLFGAVGDGVTDDSAAIETAIATGVCYFPSGIYRITRTIKISSGVHVSGVGHVLIDFNGIGFEARVESSESDNISGVVIEDLEISATAMHDKTTAISVVQDSAITDRKIFNFYIKNVYIHDVTYRGINTFGGPAGTIRKHGYPEINIENVIVERCGEIGICNSGVTVNITNCVVSHKGIDEGMTVDNGCIDSRIYGCRVTSSGGGAGAVSFDECDNVIFENCTFTSLNALPALKANCKSGNADNVKVIGCFLRSVGSETDFGVGGSHPAQVIVANCRFFGSKPINPIKVGYLILAGNVYPSASKVADSVFPVYNVCRENDLKVKVANTDYYNDGFTPVGTDRNYIFINGNTVELCLSFTATARANGDTPLTLPFVCTAVDIPCNDGNVISIRASGKVQIYGTNYANGSGTFTIHTIFNR